MIWFRQNSPHTLILEARSSLLADQWLIKCDRSNLSQFYNFFSFTIPLNESIGCRAGHFLALLGASICLQYNHSRLAQLS